MFARILFSLLIAASVVPAQQTIFDVPSGDISVKGDWFYQHQTVARAWSPERRWIQTNAFGYGIGFHTEIDTTVFNTDAEHLSNTLGSIGFKSSLPIHGDEARVPLKFVVGDLLTVGAEHHTGNWSYAMLQATAPRIHTRVIAGASAGTAALFGRRTTGVLGGVEQPLTSRLTFQADWFSGKHDLAYAIPGLVYRFSRHWMISAGYQLPNSKSPGYRAAVLELTRF